MFTKTMERWIVGMSAAAAAVGVVLVSSGIVIAQGRGVVHSVHVGGADICAGLGLKPGCDANFSLTAHEFRDGSVNGRWSDVFGVTPGVDPETIIVAIDCLHVVGNEAWVAGEIVGPDLQGVRVGTRIQDNGVSANDLPDMTSFTVGIPPGIDCSVFPGFPGAFPLFTFGQGQVTVR